MRRLGTRVPVTGPWALLVGMACIGIAIYLFLTSSALLVDGVVTQAKVVGIDSRLGSDGRTYALVIAYTDRDGVSHRERSGYGRHHRWTRIGESVQIRYHPRRPSEFVVDSWYALWMMPLVVLAIGIAGCVAFLFGPARRDKAFQAWQRTP